MLGIQRPRIRRKVEEEGKGVLGVPVEEEKPVAEKVEQSVPAVDVGMSLTPARFKKRAIVQPLSLPASVFLIHEM